MSDLLLRAAQHYHERGDWFCRICLLMPDHMHALVAPALDKDLKRIVADWKRYTGIRQTIAWQKNFIDHRIRSDQSLEEKVRYIRHNPARAGLISADASWPYTVENRLAVS